MTSIFNVYFADQAKIQGASGSYDISDMKYDISNPTKWPDSRDEQRCQNKNDSEISNKSCKMLSTGVKVWK